MNKDYLKITNNFSAYFLLILLISSLSICFSQQSFAEINSDFLDSYLKREFSYVFTIDADELPHYFNYKGSKLKPVSKVLVKLNKFDTQEDSDNNKSTNKYEEFWFHRNLPLGSKRTQELNLKPHQLGAIVLKKLGKKQDQINAATNVALRLFLDLQMKKLNLSVILVPFEEYENVALQLEHYQFIPYAKMNKGSITNGKQISIHLKSYPGGRDELFYFLK